MAEAAKNSGNRPSAFAESRHGQDRLRPQRRDPGALPRRRRAVGDRLQRRQGLQRAILQLVWNAIRDLPPERRQKPIHVITTDTLVEQPLVAAWVDSSQAKMREAAAAQDLPITPHKLTPEIEDSFWVNLIGKGYPAPRQKFRWCTERLKIRPSNKFIRDVVRQNGEAILVLGTRKAESQRRAVTMAKHEARRVRERLSPNVSLPNSLVYTPIEDWTNDDVWLYLMQVKNPWGHDNKSLLGMYQGASEGGECPLVVDTTTPSCGTSRFGCWVCTVVDKDRSMEAMIKNDEEKVWMTPLLELRNELDKPDDRDRRDFRRMNGSVQLFHDRTIPGPYTKEVARALAAARAGGAAERASEGPPRVPQPPVDHPGRAARNPAHLAVREARVRRQPSRDLRGGDRRASSPSAGTRATDCGPTTGTSCARSAAATRRSSTCRCPCWAWSGSSAACPGGPASTRCWRSASRPGSTAANRRPLPCCASDSRSANKGGSLAFSPSTDYRRSMLRPKTQGQRNDPRTTHAQEFLSVPWRADFQPRPRPTQRQASADRPVRRHQRRRQDDAARRHPARPLRRTGQVLEALQPGIRRLPASVHPSRR